MLSKYCGITYGFAFANTSYSLPTYMTKYFMGEIKRDIKSSCSVIIIQLSLD